MQKTTNYNLNQWEPTDPIRREDFNADNAAIDSAFATLAANLGNTGNCKIMTGSWIGDGTSKRTIQLPVTPKLLFIFFDYEDDYQSWPVLVIGTDGMTRFIRGISTIAYCGDPLVIALNGSTVTITDVLWCNRSEQIVNYVALY